MARTTQLTVKTIESAKGKEKVYKLSDGDGLQLRVRPNGNKSWLFDYIKPTTKKRSSIGLGGFPEVSLANARKLRDKNRELVAQGIDPKEYKDDKRLKNQIEQFNTFESVAREWFEVKRTEVTEGYATDILRSFELYAFPSFGHKPISKLTAPYVIELLKPIEKSGTLETLKRVIQRTNEVMTQGVNTGLLHSNPLAGIKAAFKKPMKTNLPTIEAEELPGFLEDVQNANMKLVTRFLLFWQLHTMTRPNEAAHAEWSEIDFEKELWIIPGARMKNGSEHKIPLTNQTLKILSKLKAISGHRKHIFPGDRNPSSHMNEQTVNDVIKRIGYSGKLVSHGFRSLASTVLNDNGFDPDVIEKALSHTEQNEVRKAYNRAKYLEKRKEKK